MFKPIVFLFSRIRAVWNDRPSGPAPTPTAAAAPEPPAPPRRPRRHHVPVTNELLMLLSDDSPEGVFRRAMDVGPDGHLVERWYAQGEVIYQNAQEPYRCRGVYAGNDDVAQRHVLLTERSLALLHTAVLLWRQTNDPAYLNPTNRHDYPAGFSRTILMRSWMAELELFTIVCHDETAREH